MTEQFLKTHTLTKSKREELDNYLTYSPRTNKRRGFYTTYQSAGGKQTLERFVDESATVITMRSPGPVRFGGETESCVR